MTQQALKEWFRNLLAAGGPASLLIMKHFAISAGDYDLYLSAFLMVAPGTISLVWAAWDLRKSKQIANVKAMPEVAKVVVGDSVNGPIGAMARSPDPKVVTTTQNLVETKGKTS